MFAFTKFEYLKENAELHADYWLFIACTAGQWDLQMEAIGSDGVPKTSNSPSESGSVSFVSL